jgi:ribosomal protein S18 acetylase RimI-like enzyme
MTVSIRSFHDRLLSSDLKAFTRLYNGTQFEQHGFFPVTPERVRERIVQSPWFDPHLLLLAEVGGEAAGFAHGAVLREPCHEEGGVVEAIGVLPSCRNRGIGRRLMDELLQRLDDRGANRIDGGGTFPFSPFYTTWLDGSERSGPATDNEPALRLFAGCGFRPVRYSKIMRADLSERTATGGADGLRLLTRPRAAAGWLDHVFRGWALHDSELVGTLGRKALSRAIYGRMSDLSVHEGRELYAVFGVRTPEALRGHGYATAHFHRLMAHLRSLGGEAAELHVFSDNEPALRLYRRVGFVVTGETVTLRRSGR